MKVIGNMAEFQVEIATENFEILNQDLRGYYVQLIQDFHKSPDFKSKYIHNYLENNYYIVDCILEKITERATMLFEGYYSRLKSRQEKVAVKDAGSKLSDGTKNSQIGTSKIKDTEKVAKGKKSEKVEAVKSLVPENVVAQNTLPIVLNDSEEIPEYSQEDWENFEKESFKNSTLSSTQSFNESIKIEDEDNEPAEKIQKFEN